MFVCHGFANARYAEFAFPSFERDARSQPHPAYDPEPRGLTCANRHDRHHAHSSGA
jgi:hypothetical protein